jgi:predicted Fe-Mo cluster-binding NifX family protein
MKIAVITDDDVNVSQHFGRAHFYLMFTVEDGVVTAKEKREKVSHNQFSGQEHESHHKL